MKTWTFRYQRPFDDPDLPPGIDGGPHAPGEIHKVPHGPVYHGYTGDGPDTVSWAWGPHVPTARIDIAHYSVYAYGQRSQIDRLKAGVVGEIDGRPLRLTYSNTGILPYSGKLDIELDGQLWRMRLRSFLPSRAVLYAPDGHKIASIPAWPPPWRVKIAPDATPEQVALAVLLRPVHLAVSHKSVPR